VNVHITRYRDMTVLGPSHREHLAGRELVPHALARVPGQELIQAHAEFGNGLAHDVTFGGTAMRRVYAAAGRGPAPRLGLARGLAACGHGRIHPRQEGGFQ
jgi:hypothetical protein